MALENCEQNIKNEALPIVVLLCKSRNLCQTMAVTVLVWKNVELIFCYDFWLSLNSRAFRYSLLSTRTLI